MNCARALRTPRGLIVLAAVRPPECNETPLSDAEVFFGIGRRLIDVLPLTTKQMRWIA